ncbi:MAG: type II toxin-antitoxin system VapC family toxin [Candidatus Thermoplasmatota archaeon]
MAVIDCSYLIALERGDKRAQTLQLRLEREGHSVRIPAPAWYEFLIGFRAKLRPAVAEAFRGSSILVAFDSALAVEAARVQDLMLAAGSQLSIPDLFIAATATALNEPLVTLDLAFDEVPGLEVIHP